MNGVVGVVKPSALQFDVVDGALLHQLAARNAAPIDAVPTPFDAWNRACRDAGGGEGIAKGWHVIIAGATGAGKSLVALNIADAAVRAGEHVCYLSLEMSQDQLLTRLMAISTGYSVRGLEPGPHHDPESEAAARDEFCEMLKRTGGSIRVNRHQLRDLSDIDMVFGYYTEREPCTVFVTDYLQLCWLRGAKTMLESITEVSHSIRARARDHRVVSIGLSQFNRQMTNARGERPRVEGLMGGSPLENDSDQVLLLDYTSHERHGPNTATTKLLLAKNRHGPQVEIPITWDYRNLRCRQEGGTTEPDHDELTRQAMREGA